MILAGLIILLIILLWPAAFGSKTHPEHHCRLCGKKFTGKDAANHADDCEADHLRDMHK